ncbi:Translation factor [Venustampulla echinocandica]|uniref:Threonylcarbamoyl-AMP synthase n=1 Tax=Venustampulla echinocandica TaxID=2656787 RepID=A0A370T8Y3_9HELO|nr:Translation factor [Venustampulla echinocandica]RDL29953.1 Translation factor [Venustampulla echinocandica]
MDTAQAAEAVFKTRILPVKTTNLGDFDQLTRLEKWELPRDQDIIQPLQQAAELLKKSNIPVGFPTETVYGLGADATRSDAVKGIYKAKGRPLDNPLIVHVCDLSMLRELLAPAGQTNGHSASAPNPNPNPIPQIYWPLIMKFWPGPLTILLPNPRPSKLAPEVTAGLPTFGARMPQSPLALSLIKLAGVPLAAPSANASTKPSPTTAEHVLHDLDGRIEIILDGGTCQVGVESTVVDGLCNPPIVLRPGGVSIDQLRECEGWECVVKGYKDASELGSTTPRAPGMKYKHYSPKAKVVLFEATLQPATKPATSLGAGPLSTSDGQVPHIDLELLGRPARIGIVRTRHWDKWAGFHHAPDETQDRSTTTHVTSSHDYPQNTSSQLRMGKLWQSGSRKTGSQSTEGRHLADIIEISLGSETKDIAHGLFSVLRELDQRNVDVIYVEGIEDEGDIAAAVMNRLRKAASIVED